jgi:hypothetical protein
LKSGRSHRDSQRLGLFGSSDDASVIVGKDDDGLSPQFRRKQLLARDVELIAVYEIK